MNYTTHFFFKVLIYYVLASGIPHTSIAECLFFPDMISPKIEAHLLQWFKEIPSEMVAMWI